MFWGEEDSPFQNLPPEMIVEVLSFVNLLGKKESRLVCRRWRWILDHPWSGLLCFRSKQNFWWMNKESFKSLLTSQLHIKNMDIQGIKMTWPVMTYSRNKFPPIRKILICHSNCEQTVITVLQYGCAQTESLKLDMMCFSLVRPDILSRMLPGIKWNQMTEMSFTVAIGVPESLIWWERWITRNKDHRKWHNNHVGGIEAIFMKANVPNLRILHLEVFLYLKNEISTGFIKSISAFMTFLERHSNTLKTLKLHMTPQLNENKIFPEITRQIFSAEQQATIGRNLKLESLDIMAAYFDTLVHFVPPCIWESDELTKLSWRPLKDIYTYLMKKMIARPDTAQPINLLIQRNYKTLTDVSITIADADFDAGRFEISWLQSCPSLRELTIFNFDRILNVHVQLPQVRKLVVFSDTDVPSVDNMATWITQSFRNLEVVHISIAFFRWPYELDWLHKFLLLPRLQEIQFRCWGREEQLSAQDLFRRFCRDKPRLMNMTPEYKEQRWQQWREGVDFKPACIIKILPVQINK